MFQLKHNVKKKVLAKLVPPCLPYQQHGKFELLYTLFVREKKCLEQHVPVSNVAIAYSPEHSLQAGSILLLLFQGSSNLFQHDSPASNLPLNFYKHTAPKKVNRLAKGEHEMGS